MIREETLAGQVVIFLMGICVPEMGMKSSVRINGMT